MKLFFYTFNNSLFSLVVQFLNSGNDHSFIMIKDNAKLVN